MDIRLPPKQLPALRDLAPAPARLRPLTLADNPAAFVLSEIAFGTSSSENLATCADRQQRWASGMRAWYGWLQARGEGVAATIAATDQVIGYARALRDTAARTEQLTEIFVHPAFQRAKVGKALLGAVLAPEVPSGWRRLIFAHPDPAALALYYRWGVYPTDSAWYLAPRIDASGWAAMQTDLAASEIRVRQGAWTRDGDAIVRLDHTMTDLNRAETLERCATQVGSVVFLGYQGSALVGYGIVADGRIGPVVGETPDATLALLQGIMLAMRDAGNPIDGMWVPGANHTILRWARCAVQRVILRGQMQIMASDPAQLAGLDRMILTAPAYVF